MNTDECKMEIRNILVRAGQKKITHKEACKEIRSLFVRFAKGRSDVNRSGIKKRIIEAVDYVCESEKGSDNPIFIALEHIFEG